MALNLLIFATFISLILVNNNLVFFILGTEVLILNVNISLIQTAVALGEAFGLVLMITVMILAAVEITIGLALLVLYMKFNKKAEYYYKASPLLFVFCFESKQKFFPFLIENFDNFLIIVVILLIVNFLIFIYSYIQITQKKTMANVLEEIKAWLKDFMFLFCISILFLFLYVNAYKIFLENSNDSKDGFLKNILLLMDYLNNYGNYTYFLFFVAFLWWCGYVLYKKIKSFFAQKPKIYALVYLISLILVSILILLLILTIVIWLISLYVSFKHLKGY